MNESYRTLKIAFLLFLIWILFKHASTHHSLHRHSFFSSHVPSPPPPPPALRPRLPVLCCENGQRSTAGDCYQGNLDLAPGVPHPCQPYIAQARLPMLAPNATLGATPPSSDMAKFCQRIPGSTPRSRARRVYDVTTFSHELVALKTRLDTMNDVIDMTVIAEFGVAFSGRPKALVLNETRQTVFGEFERIRHIMVTEDLVHGHRPSILAPLGKPATSGWEREGYHRDTTHLGLFDAAPDDVVCACRPSLCCQSLVGVADCVYV